MLDKVKDIIDELQQVDWSNPSGYQLDAKQGLLASYLANVGSDVARARYDYEAKKFNAKTAEAEEYLELRQSMTSKDAEMKAKLNTRDVYAEYLEAEKKYQQLKAIYDAMQSMIVSCQVALKTMEYERKNSGMAR